MQTASGDESDNGLPPPGNRWGAGAQSVLPYLTKSLQARPSVPTDPVASQAEAAGTTAFTQAPPTAP
jgi:hypothetical protein